MGDEQKIGYEELLAASKAAFEDGAGLHGRGRGGVRAPRSRRRSSSSTASRSVQQAAQGTELEPHLVGELIASEVEVRTGRCETFAECAERLGERRAQLRDARRLARHRPLVGRHASVEPAGRSSGSSTRRTTAATTSCLRYVVWRNNTFGLHVHVGINGADRAIRVNSALRNYLPELLAVSASSPFVEGVFTYLHSARTQIFTRMFPRCGIPDWFEGWDDWEQLRPLPLRDAARSPSTRRSGGASGRISRFRPSRSASATRSPTSREARSLAALIYSLTARIARALDEGEPLPSWPHRLLEENLWRAIRYGLSGELIDLERGESIPARARLEQLVEWVQPVAEELGAAPWLAIPERNAAERQIARHEEGASMEEIFAEQVRAGERVARLSRRRAASSSSRSCGRPRSRTCSSHTCSILASLAFGKLAPDVRDLDGGPARDRRPEGAPAARSRRSAAARHPAGRREPPARLRGRRDRAAERR